MVQRPTTAVRITALTLVALAALTGCTRRTIEVTSTPPGAVVWLNDQQVGRTPVEVEFTHFGVYDVRLKLDGYEPVSTSRHAVTPVHEYPPIDLVTAPLPIHHHITWHFDLTASAVPAPPELVGRAATLRRRATEPGVSPEGAQPASSGSGTSQAPATSQ